jgi:hypothetical protein
LTTEQRNKFFIFYYFLKNTKNKNKLDGEKMKENDFKAFGIDKETFVKSKDILPTFDLGELKENSTVYLTVLDKKPQPITHKAKFPKGKIKEGDEMETPVLTVNVHKVSVPDKDSEMGLLDISFEEKFTLWLSSKSLSLGFAKIFEDNSEDLTGIKAKIKVTTAIYKKFGENRCYQVSQTD